MNYVLDRHIGPRVVAVLKEMGVNAVHLDQMFAKTEKDLVWVPQVAAQGFVVVSIDKKMNRRPEERKMLGECGVLAFFLAEGFAHLSSWGQLEYLAKCWPRIMEKAAKPGPHRIFIVQMNGQVVPFPG